MQLFLQMKMGMGEGCMRLEKAEKCRLERIVAVSQKAFETDVAVGGAAGDHPPEYDSLVWHEQMLNEGHLFQAVENDEIIGGAVLFYDEKNGSLYVGRVFVDSMLHKKGYGLLLMELVENLYPNVQEINLDTPLWNTRTNCFYRKLGYVMVKQENGFAFYQKKRKG